MGFLSSLAASGGHDNNDGERWRTVFSTEGGGWNCAALSRVRFVVGISVVSSCFLVRLRVVIGGELDFRVGLARLVGC